MKSPTKQNRRQKCLRLGFIATAMPEKCGARNRVTSVKAWVLAKGTSTHRGKNCRTSWGHGCPKTEEAGKFVGLRVLASDWHDSWHVSDPLKISCNLVFGATANRLHWTDLRAMPCLYPGNPQKFTRCSFANSMLPPFAEETWWTSARLLRQSICQRSL